MKVRGFQVAPAELEGHLLDHSFVSDVCVVGVPDEHSGEVPLAFITTSANASETIRRGEEKLVKAQIAKVRFCARSYRFFTLGGYPDRICGCLLACRGCKGAIQAFGWWDCVYRRYSKGSKRKIVEVVVEGQG